MNDITKIIFEGITKGHIEQDTGVKLLEGIRENQNEKFEIAITGMSARFPGADNIEEYWANLETGVNCIRELPKHRSKDLINFALHFTGIKKEEVRFRQGGYLEHIDLFDHRFFKVLPVEAKTMDPNQRIFLETAWTALEDAGYQEEALKGSLTGIYLGYDNWPIYGEYIAKTDTEKVINAISGNVSSVIASRISYLLDLKGPAVNIDTACSSSMTALHTACQALRNGDCKQAVVGGVKLDLLPVEGSLKIGQESKVNQTRSFDDSSDGFLWGEGVAAVVLKPLQQALKDKDYVYAVIKGSAINQDGNSLGVAAPNARSQEEVMVQAWKAAGIDPESISYIEAHGTGTRIGDPIEISAIQKAFSRFTSKKQFCGIGSVKTAIGHLDNVSGLASLIKMVLALQHKKLPAHLNFMAPNSSIDFHMSPVYINDTLREWEVEAGQKRRCGINSFGISGTNCHIVLEEAPQREVVPKSEAGSQYKILVITAKSMKSLMMQIIQMEEFIYSEDTCLLEELCYTAAVCRSAHRYRLCILFTDRKELTQNLREAYLVIPKESKNTSIFFGQNQSVGKEKSKFLKQLMQQALTEGKSRIETLGRICSLFVEGVDADWSLYYKENYLQKIKIPLYPFQHRRFWYEKGLQVAATGIQQQKTEERESLVEKAYSHAPNRDKVYKNIRSIISRVSEINKEELLSNTNFFEMGFDSILLIKVRQGLKDYYNLEIAMPQFFGDLSTLDKLTDYVSENSPSLEAPLKSVTEPIAVDQEIPSMKHQGGGAAESNYKVTQNVSESIEEIIFEQIALMTKQLELVRNQNTISSKSVLHVEKPYAQHTVNTVAVEKQERYVPFKKIINKAESYQSEKQREAVESFIRDYSCITNSSKQMVQNSRYCLANNRNVAGYNQAIKEIVYPIIVKSASKANIYDVDGREYIDISMGFGVYLFGHNPDFITEAIKEELELGVPLGPMNTLAMDTAKLVCELSKMDRAAFYNSGSEAIMVAVRIARAVTKRDKIIIFSGSYHGTFDGVLARNNMAQEGKAVPLAPGTPQSIIKDVTVLEYGSEEAIAYMNEFGDSIAAVLVEPVQSRRPDFQPGEFLKSLREVTLNQNIALIFDEIICGFRIHAGGAQEWFQVRADLVTYGKIAGGGMPIGIVAGSEYYMNAIDGGMWNYEDESYPPDDDKRTFVAGTFCHHPSAMAAAKASLNHIKSYGNELQERLNQQTTQLAEQLNNYFISRGVAITVVHFGSLFRFVLKENNELFFYYLISRGVYVWEGRNCFLSTVHSEEDIQYVKEAVIDTVEQMITDELLMATGGIVDKDRIFENRNKQIDQKRLDEAASRENCFPMTQEQQQLWFAIQKQEKDSSDFIETSVMRLQGQLDEKALQYAIDQVVSRHEALRITISRDGKTQTVGQVSIQIQYKDCSFYDNDVQEEKIEEEIQRLSSMPFDIENGPLLRVHVIKEREEMHLLIFNIHHLVVDGWSTGVLIGEFSTFYNSYRDTDGLTLVKPAKYRDYVAWLEVETTAEKQVNKEAFWKKEFRHSQELKLPIDISSKQGDQGGACTRHPFVLEKEMYIRLKKAGMKEGFTLYNLLFSCFQLLIHEITGQNQVTIGVPLAGQSLYGTANLIGQCVCMVPVNSMIDLNQPFLGYIKQTQQHVMECLQHQPYSSHLLLKQEAGIYIPKINVIFNMDRDLTTPNFRNISTELVINSSIYTQYELGMNIVEIDKTLHIDIDYNINLFSAETIELWAEYFVKILETIEENQEILLKDILIGKPDVLGCYDVHIEDIDEMNFPGVNENGPTVRIEDIIYPNEDFLGRVNRIAEMLAGSKGVILYFEEVMNAISVVYVCIKMGIVYTVFRDSDISRIHNQNQYDYEIISDREEAEDNGWIKIDLRTIEPSAYSMSEPLNVTTIPCYRIYIEDEQKYAAISNRAMRQMLYEIAECVGFGPDRRLLVAKSSFADSCYEIILSALFFGCSVELVELNDMEQSIHKNDFILMSYRQWRYFALQLRGDAVKLSIDNTFILIDDDWVYGQIRKYQETGFQKNSLIIAMKSRRFPFILSLSDINSLGDGGDTQNILLMGPLSANPLHILASDHKEKAVMLPGRLFLEILDETDGKVLYHLDRTARRRTNGSVEILDQGEDSVTFIETVILLSDLIQDAAVCAGAEGKLLAYVVPVKECLITLKDIRAHLKLLLPHHIRDMEIYLMSRLIKDSSGNIDASYMKEQERRDKPLHKYENELLKIWAQVLRIKNLSTSDNFFELGGYSLLAMELIAVINDYFSLNIGINTLIEAPTVSEFSGVIIRELDELHDKRVAEELPDIISDPKHWYEPFPLTDVQEAYWVGRSGIFELGNIATHTYFEFDTTDLDVDRFEYAWNKLIHRHAMLRAIVLPSGLQVILESVPKYVINIIEIESGEKGNLELEKIRARMSHQVLPADQWPLFEICTSRREGGIIRIHFSVDALIMDTWSFQILMKEFSNYYLDPKTILEPLEINFRDYIMAVQKMRQTDAYERSMDYWKKRIPELPLAPELPLSKAPGSLGKPEFIRVSGELSRQEWSCLKDKATLAGLTPSGLLLAAYTEILGMWSKSDRFTINLTLFNPLFSHPQVDQIIGDFTSLTLLEVNNTHADSFKERALRIQKQLWSDLENRHVSGIEVMRNLSQLRQEKAEVLMPIVFTSSLLTNESGAKDESLRWMGDLVYNIGQTPQVWLDHEVFDKDGLLVLNWDHVKGLFPDGMIANMFSAYFRLLKSLAKDDLTWYRSKHDLTLMLLPQEHVNRISMLNQTQAEVEIPLLQDLFIRTVSKYKDRIAIICDDKSLTYDETEICSNKLSNYISNYVNSKDVVAIIMDKGIEQIIALLGILKAGGVFLPISADMPLERIKYILGHGEVKAVITQEKHQKHYKEILDLPVFTVTEEAVEKESCTRPVLEISSEDLAYIIYTSGSTGMPKGVMIKHQGAVNTVLDINERFHVNENDRILGISSLSFDLSIYDVFGMFAAGGTVVLPNPQLQKDPLHWLKLVEAHNITIWNSVPAIVEMIAEYIEGNELEMDKFKSIRYIFMSGDWIPVHLPERIKKLTSHAKCVSLGGATEASIWSILYEIDEVKPEWTSIPYGRPMKNQKVYVMNQFLEICPVWVPGKIYIAGMGLAQGYVNDQEKTDAQFICHPVTGERLYETGDFGRYFPNGNIEFLGREDAQVKIQGYRIELGEIQQVILQNKSVSNCFISVEGTEKEKQHLKAYVVWKDTAIRGQVEEKMISDPIERLRYKLKNSGIRQFETDTMIRLEPPILSDTYLEEHYIKRRSYRNYKNELIDFTDFSNLLSCLQQVEIEGTAFPKYQYSSAGGIYPVQIYLFVKPGAIEGIPQGIYYYNPKEHKLDLIRIIDDIEKEAAVDYILYQNCAFIMFLVSDMNIIRPLYGKDSLRFATIEAGLISQMLESHAPSTNIGLCQAGNIDDVNIVRLIKGSGRHVPLNCLFGGKIDAREQQLEAYQEEGSEYSILAEEIKRDDSCQEPDMAVGEAVLFSSYEEGCAYLKDYLAEKLPDYMIPRIIEPVREIPLTVNGKIDKKALAASSVNEPIGHEGISISVEEAPKDRDIAYTTKEKAIKDKLCKIVSEVLDIETVHPNDNFFDLGGSSLHLIRLNNILKKEFNEEISVIELFQNPNVAALVRYFSNGGVDAEEMKEMKEIDQERINFGKNRLKMLKRKMEVGDGE